MSLREFPCMTPAEARQLSPLQLAHVGDSVWEMLVRTELAFRGRNVHNMHLDAVRGVNAHAQAEALARIA